MTSCWPSAGCRVFPRNSTTGRFANLVRARRARGQLKRLSVKRVFNANAGSICHFEFDHLRLWPAKQLHRIVVIGSRRCGRSATAVSVTLRIRACFCGGRRVLPAFDKAPVASSAGIGAVGAEDVGDVLGHDAVLVAEALRACSGLAAVGRVTELAGARHEIGKVTRGARKLRCGSGRRQILLAAKCVGRDDDASRRFGGIGTSRALATASWRRLQ